MKQTKPDREPDLTIRDVRIDADNLTIYYKLYYSKADTEVDWVIPANTSFVPPNGFEDGTSWAVWTEDISLTKKKDYDWVYIQSMRDYLPDMTQLGKKLKNRMIKDQFAKVDSELTLLRNLFDGF